MANFSLLVNNLLRLSSPTIPKAHTVEPEPWWLPNDAPSVTRLRRAVLKATRASSSLSGAAKVERNIPLKMAA